MSDDSTPTRLLKAAVRELARAGPHGARMEAIAELAGLNKALLYRHFGSRENLFREALAFKFRRRFRVAERAPRRLDDALVYWTERASLDNDFLSLLHREAMDVSGEPLPEQELRRRYYEEQVADIDRRKAEGQIARRYESAYLLLALIALVSFPAFFPNLAKLITGAEPTSEAFRQSWQRTLRQLADALGEPPAERSSTR